MAEPGLQAQNVPAPNPPPAVADPAPPQAPKQPAQPVVHLKLVSFEVRIFRENLMRMQKPICSTPMIG